MSAGRLRGTLGYLLDQLVAIRKVAVDLMEKARRHWDRDLRPALAESGIHVLDFDDLSEKQERQVETYFKKSIFPVLTPQAVDMGHPFPHISNLSFNLAVEIRRDGGVYRQQFERGRAVLGQPARRHDGFLVNIPELLQKAAARLAILG